MPLKHDTETAMVLVLGLLIALAGAAVTFLPPLSVSVWPWTVAFILALAYPLSLYPMMKERRAEHAFRLLHFVPALILLLWLVFDLFVTFLPGWQVLQSVYTWSWSVAVVAASFGFLVLFCLRVIRRRAQRIGLLLAVFLPFIALSQLSERMEWDRQLAMIMWDGQEHTGTGQVAMGGSSSNLAPSPNGAEEQWRAELRRMQRRSQHLSSGQSSQDREMPPVRGATTGTIIAAGGVPEQPDAADPANGMPPPVLPSSGGGMESLAVLAMAGYCASLHRRTVLRKYHG